MTEPSERARRLYHQLTSRWGKASRIHQVGDPETADSRTFDSIDLAIWDTDEDCDVMSYFTLGMSERVMEGADYRVELTLGVRGQPTRSEKRDLGLLLANLTEYPFMYDRKLDWWETLSDVGRIPFFSGCSKLLLSPMFGDEPLKRFESPDDDVKILSIVPITPLEHEILRTRGRAAFLDYWEESGVDIYAPRPDGPPAFAKS